MPIVKFENIDDGKTVVWNTESELVMGRGEQSGCMDKRVSRRHVNFKILSNKILMTPLHSNPCFYMENGHPPMTIVKKEDSIMVGDGDCIGLVPLCWFKVSITNKFQMPSPPSPPINNSLQNVGAIDSTLESDNDKGKEESSSLHDNDTTMLRPETPPTPDNILPSDVNFSADAALAGEMSRTPDKVHSEVNEQHAVNRSESPSLCSDASPKRAWPSWKTDEGPSPKKLALDQTNPSIGERSHEETRDNSTETSRGGQGHTGVDSSILEISGGLTTAPSPIRTSDAETNHGSASNDTGVQEMVRQPAEATAQHVSVSSQPSASAAGLQSAPPVEEPANIKQEPGTSTSSTTGPCASTNVAVKVEPVSSNTVTTPANAAPLPPPQPRVAGRPLCQYQGACYRRNVQHRASYSHPGEADWVPEEQRPICQYDPNCYRTSLAHRVAVRHTCEPQPRPPPTSANGNAIGNLVNGIGGGLGDSDLFSDIFEDWEGEEDPYTTDDGDDDEYRPEE